MLEIKRVYTPIGKPYSYYKGDGQTWTDIVCDKILPCWEKYCSEHWISVNHEDLYAPEKRVKAFLDRCAWLLLQDNPDGIESDYKAMSHAVREIPVTECPPGIVDYFYSERRPPVSEMEDAMVHTQRELMQEKLKLKTHSSRKKKETKFERLERIIKAHPDSIRTWQVVDANNQFVYCGVPRRIVGYDGYEQSGQDRIFVIDCHGILKYYDQFAYPIPDECVDVIA